MQTLITNANLSTCKDDGSLHVRPNMYIEISNGKISNIGRMGQLKPKAQKIINLEGKLIAPGFIDAHTHLVYASERTNEFEQRLQGATYAQIAANGGGIISTIEQTRQASVESLYEQSAKRLKALMSEGVTTVEIKSGYGLETLSEIKMLQVAQKLGENFGLHVEKTFLGAHAVPPEYKGKAQEYCDYVCEEMMPKIVELGLASGVDVYCENLAFTLEQTRQVFQKAASLGLKIKLHAEQFSSMGGTELACEFGALSVDHLEFTKLNAVKVMAKSGTVAMILPGAFYMLGETQKPPIELFREHKIPMAIATDLNPGTAPICSLHLAMQMGCVLFGMRVDEVFAGVTMNAAKALGIGKTKGQIRVGFDADFAIFDASHPRELIGEFRPNRWCYSIINGEIVDV
jgi:imidazolonepropionase